MFNYAYLLTPASPEVPILLECIDVKKATFLKQKTRMVFG
jgi:hypothetical protein